MLEVISDEDSLLAIILRRNFKELGVHFFTPGDFSQQLGYMNLWDEAAFFIRGEWITQLLK
jgi:hypothetical protein